LFPLLQRSFASRAFGISVLNRSSQLGFGHGD
jgi:hypothetical protein